MKKYFTILLFLISEIFLSQNAIQFNGTNAYITFGNNANLGLPQFSLECWFKRLGGGTTTSTGSGGITAVPLISKGRGEADGSNLDMNYFLGIRQSDSTLIADFEEGSGGTTPGLNHPIVGVTKLARNTWYHVSITYNGSTWKLYLNGQLENQLTINQPVQHLSVQHSAIGSACTSNGTAQGFFNGIIDEVRIWNTARTQTQVVSTINSAITGTASNLVARWGFNEGSGTSVLSSAGTGITGTITGSNWSWVTQQAPFNLNMSPSLPTSILPLDSSKCTSIPTKLSVNISDANGDSLWVKFYGRVKSNAKDFSIIPLPDTQYYTSQINGATNTMYKKQMSWVVAKKDSLNIKFISGLGDCVENGDNSGNDVEWKRADTAMKIVETATTSLLTSGIPYGLNVGNHDQSPGGNPNGTTTFYNQYFGTSRFSGRNYWGGNYGSNADNNYQLFTAEGIDFLVINLEYDVSANSSVLAWAAGLIQTYSSRKVIVASHWLVNLDGSFSAQGQATYNAFKSYPNFFLMLCGHVAGEARRNDVYNGNTVHSLMSDYQGRTNGGNGWIRVVKLRPSAGKINVTTYSPYLNQSETDADSQFSLDYDFGPAFTLIDSVKIASGQNATRNWASLSPSTNYQWYAKISDGNSSIKTSVYEFQTKAYQIKLPKDTTLCNSPFTVTVASSSCAGCTTFSWMNGASTPSLSINTSSQVIVNVTDSLNCLSRDTMQVNILSIPIQPSIISGEVNPCIGSTNIYSVSLTSGINYSWTVPAGWSGTTTLNALSLVTDTSAGVLSVLAGNLCGSSPSRTLQINANSPPIIPSSISGNTSVCFGLSALIYSVPAISNASNYDWVLPSLWSGTNTANSILITPNATGNLSVAASNSCGISPHQTMAIVVNGLPTITINQITNTICVGNALLLQSSGANSYTWNNGVNSSTILTTPSITTIYSVTGTDANGCQNIATTSIIVNPLPTISIASTPTNAIVCAGSTLNLNASGATTYSWTNGIVNNSTFTPTTGGTYSVTGNLNGCMSSATTMVVVNALPVLVTTGLNQICAGQNNTLSVSGANSYSWNTGATSASIVVSPSVSTTYSVMGTATNGCQNLVVRTITVNALPVVAVISTPSNAIICNGSSLTLSGTGATTYTWSGGLTNATAFSPTTNTSYTVTGTDNNGCQNSAVQSVTVNAIPAISINGNTVICAGQSTTLYAAGANSYTWSTISNSTNINVNPTSTSTYSVIGTDNNGCLNTATKTVTVNAVPVITVNSGAVCPGFSFTLTPSGAATYTYSSGSNIVTPPVSSVYSISGTSALGCTASVSALATVNVTNSLTVSVSGPTAVCLGSTANLTASGASSFAWNTGATSNTITIAPTIITNYTVIGSTTNCSNTAVFAVGINTLPIVNIVASKTAVCLGQTLSLNANGANNYMWNTGSNNPTITLSPLSNITYTLTGYNSNGCFNSATQFVKVNPLPIVLISSSGNTICVGESTTLTASGANSYVWNDGVATDSNTVNPITDKNYSVTGSDLNGCSNSTSLSLKVNACTGIEELTKAEQTIVYPNPSSGTVFFDVKSNKELTLHIYNALGQLVVISKMNNGVNTIVLDNVKGIYFYNIQEGFENITAGKLIIN